MYIDVSQRFTQVVKYLINSRAIKNQVELAQILSLSKGYVSQLVNGQREPSSEVVSKLANSFPIINENWLLTGEGEMLKSETTQNSRGDNTIQVSGTNVDLRNINQSKGGGGDAKRVKELERRIEELTEDKRRLQEMVDKMQLQISKLLEKI